MTLMLSLVSLTMVTALVFPPIPAGRIGFRFIAERYQALGEVDVGRLFSSDSSLVCLETALPCGGASS